MTRFLRNISTQRLFVFGLLLVFAFVSVQYSMKAAKGKSAINRWAPQIQQLETGEDIHRQYNYPNPPIMALLLWPISELVTINPMVGALTWFYLKVAMAIFCVFAVFRLVETPAQPFPAWAKALTVMMSIRPIIGDLSHGNVNIFILFLIVSSLAAFRRGRDVLAGVLLALAVACKVTPALLVGYFVWKRAGRVLAGVAIGLAAFFLVIPALFLGWEQNWRALSSWFDVMILPFVAGGFVTPEHNNQSLPGLLARFLTAAPSFSTYVGDLYVPLRYDNIVDIGPRVASWIVKGAMALFAVVVIWTCRTPIHDRPRQGWRLAAEYSLICLGMLLFSERTWKHHCVTLLLPFAVLSYGLASSEWSLATKRFFGAVLVTAMLLIMSTSTGLYGENIGRTADQVEATIMVLGPAGTFAATQAGIYTDSLAKLAQVYGAYVWAFGLLAIGLAVQLSTCRTPVREPTQTTYRGNGLVESLFRRWLRRISLPRK